MHATTLPGSLQLPTDVPFTFSLDALFQRLQTLVDHRDPRGVRYPLAPLLTLAVCAKVAGASHVEALADWVHFRAAALTTLFGLPRPTMPHARTWGRIFAQAVDPVAFDRLIGAFFQSCCTRPTFPSVAVVCGRSMARRCAARFRSGPRRASTWSPPSSRRRGVVVAQLAVASKVNEIVVVPTLVAQVDGTGVVVTGDAMQTQRSLNPQIVAAGGDDLWFVKDNQPTLQQDVERLFAPEVLAPGCGPISDAFRMARTIEQQHGRLDERSITVSRLLNDYAPCPSVEQVFKRERTVTDGLGRVHQEVRYGITSLPAQVAVAHQLLRIARAEWGIEHGLHYRRDASLDEDRSQMRRGVAPHILATLNTTVVSLAGNQGVTNLAKVQREFQYRFDRALARIAHMTRG